MNCKLTIGFFLAAHASVGQSKIVMRSRILRLEVLPQHCWNSIMALRVLPFGGGYIAGGIALKILPKLEDGSFVHAFTDKQNSAANLHKSLSLWS